MYWVSHVQVLGWPRIYMNVFFFLTGDGGMFAFVFSESAGADVCSLDQVTISNTSDQEALDDFLNSGGYDVSTASSLTSGNLTH